VLFADAASILLLTRRHYLGMYLIMSRSRKPQTPFLYPMCYLLDGKRVISTRDCVRRVSSRPSRPSATATQQHRDQRTASQKHHCGSAAATNFRNQVVPLHKKAESSLQKNSKSKSKSAVVTVQRGFPTHFADDIVKAQGTS
jgi:hypothetical protein